MCSLTRPTGTRILVQSYLLYNGEVTERHEILQLAHVVINFNIACILTLSIETTYSVIK